MLCSLANPILPVVLFLGIALTAVRPVVAQSEPGSSVSVDGRLAVVDYPGQHTDLLGADGRPLVRYIYQRDTSTKESTFDTAKVFAHVMAPDGETTLTSGAGGAVFPHHRGIFVGWNKILHDGQSHDLWHVRDTEQKHIELAIGADNTSAFVKATIHWIGKDGKPLIEEVRTYRLVESKDAYAVIDLTSQLTAVAGDLVLDGDPEHAGIQFRPAQEVAQNKSARYTFHADNVDPTKQVDLPWVACSFTTVGQEWTVQHINHPDNPTGARWSAYRDYGRFGPFPVIRIGKGETQELRFRFRVTQGETPAREALAAAASEFAG